MTHVVFWAVVASVVGEVHQFISDSSVSVDSVLCWFGHDGSH